MKNAFLPTLVLLSISSLLYGQGIGIVDGVTGDYLEIVETRTTVEVRDQIAIVTSAQVFRNSGPATLFKYGFPLNETSNPIELRWYIDGQWKAADVAANEQDNTVPGGGDPGDTVDPNLVEYLGDFPIFFTPNDTLMTDSLITMEMTYVELLPYFLGKVSFYQRNAYDALQSGVVPDQYFDFSLNSNRPVLSAELLGQNGVVEITPEGATVSYYAGEQVADFDYELEYELSSDGLGINSLSTYLTEPSTSCDDISNGYFTFIVEPESNVDTDVIEKAFTLVIDRSGSMSGDKIVQARDAATFIVQNLNYGDKFNIVDFSSTVTSFAATHVDYTNESRDEALNYIDGIQAGGSTNISGALTTSIEQFGAVSADKANIVIFFTDGLATAGITDTPGILDAVADEVLQNETNIFLFTFGVGAGVNEALLTLLAQQNNGLVNFIEPQNLQSDLTTFFLSINNPVLLNTEVSFSPNVITEVYPFPFPNLYQGQQLIVSGRYDEPVTINVHIEGQAFNVPVTYDFEVDLADTANIELSFLPKIWAKQKIDALQLDYYTADASTQQQIQADIDSLSVCYGVVDIEFSSFEDNNPVEVDELEMAGELEVFPSPFTDQLSIRTPIAWRGASATVKLLNAWGQIVWQQADMTLLETVILTDLGDLPAGVYLCQLEVDGQTYIGKVVKI